MTKRSALGLGLLSALAFFVFTPAFSQRKKAQSFSKELSIISDNDFYLLKQKDGYYTNGLVIKYNAVVKNNNAKIFKKINRYEVGQLLFNQGNRKIRDVALIDRPLTGYLYGKLTRSVFINKNKLYEFGASVGAIGEAGLGKNMQNFFHRQINVNSNYWGWVWDYQLKDEIGVNLHGGYAASLINSDESLFQATPQVHAALGTTFTNISTAVVMQLGKFNKIGQSAYWGSYLNSRSDDADSPAEYFLFYHPRLMYQAYNATIQGGLFRGDKGPITSSAEPLVFLHEAGFVLSKSRYSFSYTITHMTREAKSQKSNHAYGRVQLAYRFR